MAAATKPCIFQVDETSDLPIWVQLRNRLAYLIRKGELKPGEQLPSVRSLAADANINYNTVTRAYRDLELAGLVVTFRGRGMFVTEGGAQESKVESIDALARDCIKQYRSEGLSYEDVRERLLEIVGEAQEESNASSEIRERYLHENENA